MAAETVPPHAASRVGDVAPTYTAVVGRPYAADACQADPAMSAVLLRYFNPVPLDIVERRAGDVAELWAEPGLVEDSLAWRAANDLLAMCEDTWRWQRANPQGYA